MVIGFILVLGVIFVNGWTDAPNAISSCVCSGALSMKRAVLLAAVCNFLGVSVTSIIASGVAKNIFETTKISEPSALCAALLSVIILAVGAWVFGIPTSESHAIISSLCGAALASGVAINSNLLIFTLIGLILSVGMGFVLGYYIFRSLNKRVFKEQNLKRLQIAGASVMAFMHGAQDGQKFISILLFAIGITGVFKIPVWTVLVCSTVMALGTALGGGRIIRKVGKTMVDMDLKLGSAADIAGGISLLTATVLGMPVSTTHAKTASVIGCGYAKSDLNKKTASEMLAAWVITFPVCFVLGYVLTKLFSLV